MPEIDKLFINIDTDAKGSYNAIGKFAEKIGNVATALNGVNTSKMTTLASGIKQLGNSMGGMQSVGTADFTRLIKNVNRLNTIDTSNLSKVSASVRNIGNSLNGLTNVGKSAEQLSALAKGISQLGYKSSTKAIENIPKLATAMKQFMATMSNAPKVSQNLIDMTNAMAKFARTGSSGGNAANSLAKSFNGYSSSTKTAKKHSFSLASAIGKVYATYWTLFRVMGKVKEAINISADLTEVQNVVDVTFGNMAGKVEELADVSIEKFGMSELSLKRYASRFQAMGSAMSIDTSSIASANKYLSKQTEGYAGLSNSMSDVSLTLTKLTADMASFYNMEQEDVAKDLESIFTGQTRPLRTYGLDLTEATLKEWALKNGMDANIKSMSQAEKTMLRYKYVLANTTNAQGDFERTADTWTNQTRILKQNLEQLASVVGGTLIGAFKPLVKTMNVVIGQITNFATIVSNAIGKIFGWTYEESGNAGVSQDFESAADSSQDIADSTGTAADNIKKMNAGVRAFDKLTVINTNKNSGSSSSGSGSSSSGASDSASGGKWTQGNSIIKSFESEIDSLYKLGAKISSTLITTMGKIDWNSVYEKARGFGSGLANFLNGLFAGSNGTTLFGSLGKTIAGALNTSVQSALSFAKTFDFKQFGVNIADGINNFFGNYDFKSASKAFSALLIGIMNTAIGFLDNVEWRKIPEAIVSCLSGIDWLGILKSVGKLIVSYLSSAVELAYETLDVFSSGELSKQLGVEDFKYFAKVIEEKVRPVLNFLSKTALPDLKKSFKDVLNVLKPLGNFIGGVFSDSWNKILKPALSTIAKEIVPTLFKTFKNLWSNILVPLGSFLTTAFKPAIDIISSVLTILWKDIVLPLADVLITSFVSAFKTATDIVNSVAIPIFNTVINLLTRLWKNVINPLVNVLKDVLGPAFKNVFDTIKDRITSIKTIFNGFTKFISGALTKDWKKAWSGIRDIFVGIWSGLKAKMVTPLNGVLGLFEGVANKIIDAWNTIKKAINSLKIEIPKGIPGIGGTKIGFNLEMTKHTKIPRFESGGYVPRSYTMFMAGENNVPEMLGTVGGKTAVVGGKEITGISDTIRATSREEITLLKQQNALLQGILQKEFGITKDDIGKAAQNYAKDYYKKTGKEAFIF